MSYIGVDLGTTRIKALVYDPERRQAQAVASVQTPVATTELGLVHHPAEIFEAVLEVVGKVLAQARRASGGSLPVEAIAVASVGEEVVLVDGRGRPVDDALTWYNQLGQDEAPRLIEEVGGSFAWPLRPDPTFSFFKLAWLSTHRRWAFGRAASFTDLGSYVTCSLAGLPAASFVMDWSHASRTGFYRPECHDWDHPLAARSGVAPGMLPRLVPSGSVVGPLGRLFADHWRITGDCLVVAGGHDHFCGAYACGVSQAGELFISAGTSEAQVVLSRKLPDSSGLDDIDLGSFVDSEHAYLHVAIPSGQLFGQWRALLYGDASDTELYSELERVPVGSDGIRCLVDRRRWRMTLRNVPTTAGRAAVMRSLLEGLAIVAERVTASLEAASGTQIVRVLAAGVPTRHRLWREIRAATCARPLSFVVVEEPSALGAALLAQRAVTGSAPTPELAVTSIEVPAEVSEAYGALRRDYEAAAWRPAERSDEI